MSNETQLKRHVSGLGLLFISLGAMIGSGWLFAALYAASTAGPASILSWVIGSVMVGVIAIVFAELGAMLPLAGGLARFPHIAFGGLTSFIAGWLCWLGYVVIAPVETLAILEYLGNIIPWLTTTEGNERSLTVAGTAVAAAILCGVSVINLLGVRWVSHSNTWLTWWKIAVPVATALVLMAYGFDSENFSRFGFMPTGWSGVFAAVASGGVVFSLVGFRAAIELAGEARNPQRDIPRAIIGSVIITTIIYIVLQVAFIGVIPEEQLAQGWSGIVEKGSSGPFAAFAMVLGLSWLAIVLYIDATVSPLGTALVYTAGTARLVLAMSTNRSIPKVLGRLTRRGIPLVALMVNLIVGMTMLAPLPGWDELAGIVSATTLLTGGIGALGMLVLRRRFPDIPRPFRVPMGEWVAALAFVFASLIFFWCGWEINRTVLIVLVAGLCLLVCMRPCMGSKASELHVKNGMWVLVYLAGMFILSWLSTYQGGAMIIPSPWGECAVAMWCLVTIPIALRSGLGREQSAELMDEAVREIKDLPEEFS